MVEQCKNDKVRWYIAESWVNVRGFCEYEALAGYPNLKMEFDVIRKEIDAPKSIVARLFGLLPNKEQKVRIFLHTGVYKEKNPDFLLYESVPLLGGIHVYEPNDYLSSPISVISTFGQSSLVGRFVHELWHVIIGRKKPENDLAKLLESNSNNAWENSELKERGFEEIVADILEHLSILEILHKSKVDLRAIRITERGIKFVLRGKSSTNASIEFQPTASKTIFSNYACLSAFILDPKLHIGKLVSTILGNGTRMSLETFLERFSEEHPEEAKRLMHTGKCAVR